MTPKIRKRLFRFLLLPILILIVLVGIAVGILLSQQQRLVHLAVTELNKKLPGELVVGGSDISVFQNFPYISIGLQDVKLLPDKVLTDKPIYEAESMYVGFSLPDILKQQYHVKALLLKNGHLDLVEEKNGELNIVEAVKIAPDTATKTTTAGKALDLDIKKFVLKNMRISWSDSSGDKHLTANIDRIQAALRDEDGKINADLKGALLADYTHRGGDTLFRHKHLQADIKLSYDQDAKFLRLPVGKIKLEDAAFNLTGTVDMLHDNTIDLHITGDKPDFHQLFSFAPPSVAQELKHFRYDGLLSFDGAVKGKLKGREQPLITLAFTCKDAWLHNTKANKKLDSLSFKGFYTNGAEHSLRTSELRLTDMTAKPDKGKFTGNFVLRDFTDPKILMQVNSELELGFFGAFLGIKDLERLSGHITLKMNFKELVDLSLPEKEMSELTEGIQSELTIRNLSFRAPSYAYTVENLNCHANMKDGFVKLDSLACKIGSSDFHCSASLDDLPALFHHQEKPVKLTFNAHSNKIVFKELLSFDTVKSRKAEEEEQIDGFNIDLALQTSVQELLHPKPIPKGKLTIANLYASFVKYPHDFKNFGADLTINDTTVALRNFAGNIDSSDIRFNGQINNYPLWFNKVKKGKTLIAFDLRSQRLALRDLVGKTGLGYLPKDLRQEVGRGIKLRSRMELRYDSVFQFANVGIANISGTLQSHNIRLDSINGNIKFGADHYIKLDTLNGNIGNSDFNISMRLYTGKDSARRAKENYLRFSSDLLDVDELTNYALAAEQEEEETAAMMQPDTSAGSAVAKATTTSAHANAFNIFNIPFVDFNARVNIGTLNYHNLGIKNISTTMRITATNDVYLDAFSAEMAGGKLTAQAHIDGTDPKKIYLYSTLGVEDMDIEKMMLKLDNFGQDVYINKNVKGIISGQIKSTFLVHPDFTPMIDQSQAQMDIEVLNGVLANFAPMQAMSAYFIDKNLNKVRFDTLRNTLTFKNGALLIPDMNINSSLGFMEISGRQSLNMQMEYYIRVPLKLVTSIGFHKLFGKKREEVNPDQVDAIEYRDKDKRVHFINLKITGTPDNYKVALGKAKKSEGLGPVPAASSTGL
ncbi:AsmA family protein [Puia dinghuensis]|uniref:AsmA domain-containing protein n=1 Tax=Puia dinghuensis TaxID=1792502 RepID=A0A8J2U7U4_9BACT|nr:AsmA-like C-terminal region-containing protein [Puia dinghuensis]GGA84275.1 hypothetical protein GCM10011511_04290 [Puia dinghuensis]